MKTKVAVIGDGGWGTALALLLERKGQDVLLWSAFSEYANELRTKRENVKFLKGVPLPQSLKITSDLDESLAFGDYLVFAIPTQFIRNVVQKIKPNALTGKTVVSVAKGIEKKTLLRPSQIIDEHLHPAKMAVLSGPSHAEEVARCMPACVVVASQDMNVAKQVQEVFMESRFRIYTSNDVLGVELGGAVKNVIAVSAGICDGLQFGSNAKSALLSRGLIEIARLGVRMGAQANTFFGLSGLGDLVTTCISEFGRNRRVGELIGQGQTLEQILKGMDMVAEGVETSKSVMELSKKYQVEMPIATEVYKVLFENKPAVKAVEDLMLRDAKVEIEWKVL